MSGQTNGPRRTDTGRASPRRLTHAETIARQKAIAYLHDVERLPWSAIAEREQIGEKEARETYRRYHEEIVPLLIAEPAEAKAAELLRDLDEIRQRQLRLAATASNESVAVGAMRDATKSIEMEFRIRRALGLMPRLLANSEVRSLADAFAEVLARYGVPEQAVDEIAEILDMHTEEE